MVIILCFLLLVGACLCFGVAAFATTPPSRPSLLPLGLLLFAAAFALQMLVRIA